MAENSNIQFDDFIANVQPDPAKPEATIMLFGYVGHGADGEVRVYPDPTLANWYDIPAADILHSVPASDAKLGGSYVWVRASAQINPGSTAAAAAPAPDAAAAPAPDAAAAAAAPAAQQAAPNFTIGAGCTFICAQPGGGVHPTPTAQPTPATHCFICPPRTIVTETCTPAVGCTFNVHCVHPTTTVLTTPATLCSPAFICNQPSPPAICNIVASPNCPGPGPGTPVQMPQLQAQAAAVTQNCPAPTVATICTQPPACPPHTVPPACPVLSAPPHCPTVPPICPVQTVATVCTQPPACIHRTFVDCTIIGCTHIGCTHIGCPTAATVCTQPPACPHLSFAPPCPSVGIACTVGNCPTQPNVCQHTAPIVCLQLTQPQICNVVASPNCPGPGTPVQAPQIGPQQQFAAAAPAAQTPVNCWTNWPCASVPPICTMAAGPGPAAQAPQAQPHAPQPTPTVQTHCFVCPPLTQPLACQHRTFVDCTIIGCTLILCPTQPNVCTHPPGCVQPTAHFICSETCVTLPINCIQHTQPNICNIAVSPNCPGPGPGTPVQTPQVGPQQQFAAAAVQPTPTAQTHCFVCPPVTQPPACQPSVNVICPTPSAVHQCGGNTAAPPCHPSVNVICPTPSAVHQCGGNTAAPACHPSVNVICPTPSAVHQCGGNTAATVCQPSVNAICPTPSAVHQCGVFTPFCPQ